MRRASGRNATPAGVSVTDRVVRSIELDAEFGLELLDLPAQRRLRHVQALGGAAEVQFLGDGDEAGQPRQ